MVSWNNCVWIKLSQWTAYACVEETVLGLIWWIPLFCMEIFFTPSNHTQFIQQIIYLVFQIFIQIYSEIKYSITYWYSQHTRYGFEPISFRIPASHYFRYFCLECIIEVESFLNFLNAVLTSYQPPFESAVIWN